MSLRGLVVSILTLSPPQAWAPAPIEGPEQEDLTVVAVWGVVDRRHDYVLRRNLAIAYAADDLTFELVMQRVVAGNAIKARLLRHFRSRTEPMLAARRRRVALLGPNAFLRRSA